jgi:predicted ribosomally synthesized peptide with SipW-like signal peptide
MKRWLLPIFMVVMLAIGTLGAYAYFDSTRETTGYISAGTLDLKLGLTGTDPWTNSVALPWNFTNMAPGETVVGDLWMKNVGSIPSQQVTFEWHDILNNPVDKDFAEQIILLHVWDSKNTADAITQFIAMADGATLLPLDGKCSLAELAALNIKYPIWDYDVVTDVEPFLADGIPQFLHMEFQFNPDAGNEFQGVSLSYGLTIVAEQEHVFP